ncbi:MAG: RNA methyltransferase [Lutispora sp.]|nr:RNA methyltransferase [Lutispora sp.]
MRIITSNQNKIVKYAKSLQLKKHRESTGEYLLEGIKLLKEAVKYDGVLSSLLYYYKAFNNPEIQEIINLCVEKKIPIYELEEKPFTDISETKTSQGIIGIGKKRSYDMDSLLREKSFNIILLEEVQDPGNLGTIIRTADACGFDLVVLSKGCADIYSGKTIRSTMGSIFHIPIMSDIDLEPMLSMFEEMGVLTLATVPHGGTPCHDIEYADKNAILIGNESKGLPDNLIDMIKAKASIPMIGRAESLNAGVAASVMMYEIMRYKLKK